jgi:hypothetical protein
MKEPSGNLDFIKLFGNQEESLTDAEKMEAAYKLSALVDDLLLRFADDVDVDEFTYLDGHSVRCASLVLKISLGDGEDLSVTVSSHLHDKPKDKIGLEENIVPYKYVNLNCSGETHFYHVEELYEALRYDSNSDRNIGMVDDTVSSFDDILAIVDNERENMDLEKELGVNDQPVRPGEIDELARLLEGAERLARFNAL